jgi:holo-[acyl-carrier protein] synthase
MLAGPTTMQIIGMGIDATEIDRVRELLDRYGDRFLHRIFTDGEIAYCLAHRDPAPSLAARFAAKEAAMKALGTGRSIGVLWKDVEVVRRSGPPRLNLHGGAARRLQGISGESTLLTLTHARDLAIAHVLILGNAPADVNSR